MGLRGQSFASPTLQVNQDITGDGHHNHFLHADSGIKTFEARKIAFPCKVPNGSLAL